MADFFHGVVAKGDGLQDLLFGEELAGAFDHFKDSLFGPGDDQVKGRDFLLFDRWVDDELVLDEANADSADGLGKRDVGETEGGEQAQIASTSGEWMASYERTYDEKLDVVVISFLNHRTDRTVDQARGEGFSFCRASFTFNKSRGSFSDGQDLPDNRHEGEENQRCITFCSFTR